MLTFKQGRNAIPGVGMVYKSPLLSPRRCRGSSITYTRNKFNDHLKVLLGFDVKYNAIINPWFMIKALPRILKTHDRVHPERERRAVGSEVSCEVLVYTRSIR